MKKLLRTLQVYFPWLLDTKFSVMRFVRNLLRVPFEADFRALALLPESNDALFLDVGANRGQSADAILMMRTRGRIWLFEPNRSLFAKLERLFGANKRVVIKNFGLGDENDEGTLVVPYYRNWMFDGLASFDESKAAEWLEGRVFFYNAQLLSLKKSTCSIKRLDDLGLAPFFIKLDIQGYEYKALKGGEQTFKKHEPILLIETPDRITVDYLEKLGFRAYTFKKGRFIPGIQNGLNTYFMTEGKSRLIKDHIDQHLISSSAQDKKASSIPDESQIAL